MQKLQDRFNTILKNIQNTINVNVRCLNLKRGKVAIIYIRELTNKSALSEQVIKPIINHDDVDIKPCNIADFVYSEQVIVSSDDSLIQQEVLQGLCVLVFSFDRDHVIIDVKHVEKRSVPEPEITYTIRGPKDCFTESMKTNLSLIRYRIKDENLKIDTHRVGRRTDTKVNVLYLGDVANDTCVNEVNKRIENIDADGLIESGELQAYMLNKKLNLFPQMGIIERSDMACNALLEGKVIVLVEGSCWALVAPKVMSEFLWSCEDFYDNKYVGFFLRLLRVVSLFISFTVTSFYIAVVSFHNDILPGSYMIAIAKSRAKVPFNALVEVLLIELIVELIRESLVRVPKKIGTAIGIVGAIIIGQAAVAAGVFSPLLLIVVSISLIASFVPSDYTLVNPFRLLKFILIIATGTFGLFGFTLGMTWILTNLVSINTFGVPYMAPFAPFGKKDFFRAFFYSKSIFSTRPEFLKTKNKNRGKGNVNQK